MPTKYFIKLSDFKGGQTYLKWFDKTFPDDCGFPDFLFEWTVILFKCGKTKEAEKKAFETFCSNTYLFDKFFSRPITQIDKREGSNLEGPDFTQYFDYLSEDPTLADFSEWLKNLIASEAFKNRSDKYVDIYKRLKHETDSEKRHYLNMQARQIEEIG